MHWTPSKCYEHIGVQSKYIVPIMCSKNLLYEKPFYFIAQNIKLK